MAGQLSAHRSLGAATLAAAAIAILAVLAGLLSAPAGAAAKGPTGAAAAKSRKKTHHRRTKPVRHKQRKPAPSASAPAATAPVLGGGPAVGAAGSTAPPKATAKPSTPATTPTPPSAPTPPAPPSASTPPSSSLLMQGSSIRSFWLNNSEPGAVTEVPDPAGSSQTVFKFTVGDSDKTQGSTPNPRAELISRPNINAGSEFWWSTKFFLPADFPAATPGWVNLLQGPFGAPPPARRPSTSKPTTASSSGSATPPTGTTSPGRCRRSATNG